MRKTGFHWKKRKLQSAEMKSEKHKALRSYLENPWVLYTSMSRLEGQLCHFGSNAYRDLLSDLRWIEVDDRHKKVSRSSCWMVDRGCTCTYQYGHGKPWRSTLWPKWVKNVALAIEELLKLQVNGFNSCNGNRYATVEAHLQWPNDNESLFVKDAFNRDVFIASLSFGASRECCIRENYDKQGSLPPVVLEDGDLLTMERLMQETHEHCVKASIANADKSADTVRFNLSFRSIKKHVQGCQQCS